MLWFKKKEMLTLHPVIRNIIMANFHKDGLKCAHVFDVENTFMDKLRFDVQKIIQSCEPSDVSKKEHVTYWTNPFGEAKQYSLYNKTGKTNDTSCDHTMPSNEKAFVIKEGCQSIRHLIDMLIPLGLMNMRLNKLGPNSGLSPHEEHICHRCDRRINLRVRFHIPVFTQVSMAYLDGEWFQLEEGKVYYFNNGCVHASKNPTSHDRYHLVWDMMLTHDCFKDMFFGSLRSLFFSHVGHLQMKALSKHSVDKYETYPSDVTLQEALNHFDFY